MNWLDAYQLRYLSYDRTFCSGVQDVSHLTRNSWLARVLILMPRYAALGQATSDFRMTGGSKRIGSERDAERDFSEGERR